MRDMRSSSFFSSRADAGVGRDAPWLFGPRRFVGADGTHGLFKR
jgi:hypothetical protein